ncbi:MAG TPA: proton-conducting transporter membrane subunit [Longimicrobiales bacterium]|nr:proton-conducting transporter membrane subunit [Longimicrobiales bacterium]
MTTVVLLELAVLLLVAGAVVSLALARSLRAAGWTAVAAVGASGLLVWIVVVRTLSSGPDPEATLASIPSIGAALTVHVDALSAVFLATVATIAFLCTLFSVEYMTRFTADGVAKYYPVLQLLIAGIVGVVATSDFFFFLVFWEVMTLTSFFLVIYEGGSPVCQKAGLKYFVVNQGAALAMLAAGLILWRVSGSFHFGALRDALGQLLETRPAVAHLALLLLFLGFATKAGILPMGSWLPDAYPAAPGGAAAFFGGAMTKLGVYGLLRAFLVFLPLSGATVVWGWVIAAAGLGSLFVGTLMALKQDDVKRLMSFHAIGQMGYMFLAIGFGMVLLATDPFLAALGLLGGIFHVLNNALYKSGLFLTAAAVEYRTGERSLAALPGGLGAYMAVTAGCAVVASLAIAGVPPLNGFSSKWLIYATGILGAKESTLLPVATLAAMFISLVTLASFLKYLGGTFLGVPRKNDPPREVSVSMQLPQIVLALACLAFGLFPAVPLGFVHQAVASLPSASGVPALGALLGDGSGLGVARAGVEMAIWAPLPVAAVLVLLGLFCYRGIQRAGDAPIREVQVWTCGEEVRPEEYRYPPGSFYRPFKEAFSGIYPKAAWRPPPFPVPLRRILDPDAWLYLPLVRGVERAARGVSRTHVGVPQVYLLWMVVGVVAVVAILLLAGS